MRPYYSIEDKGECVTLVFGNDEKQLVEVSKSKPGDRCRYERP